MLLSTFFSGQAQAAFTTSPEVVKGLTWLQAQVQATGTLTNEAVSIATPLQNRAETLQALKLLATIPVALADQLAADPEDNTEYLARRAVTLSLAGRDVSAITTLLAARQNLNGGFGGAMGHDSNALDTAWVMLAMAQNTLSTTPAAQTACNYLLAVIQPDGGVGTDSDSARISENAVALLALQMSPSNLTTATALKQISTWLLLKQGVDGSWLGDSYLTALALSAVSPLVSDPAIRAAARTYLTGLQGLDGSWGGDPFLTAVVLRALAFEPAVAPVVVSSIIGQVVDQNTATPLAGAAVALSGAATATATTAIDGKLSFANLAAGSYTLQVSKAGYTPYSKIYQLNAGQTLDVGVVALAQLQTTGIVRGQVTASGSGLPISGATVSLNGGTSKVTDASGFYEFVSVPPGAVTLSATSRGYLTASGSGSVVAGQTLLFSPVLFVDNSLVIVVPPVVVPPPVGGGTPAPGPLPTTGIVSGQITAAATGLPISGATMSLNGGASLVTDVNGRYTFAAVPPGAITLSAAVPGYTAATGSGSLLAGQTLVFSPALNVTGTTAPTTGHFTGKVVVSGSGSPLAGVGIQLNGAAAGVTAIDGSFDLVLPPASYSAAFTLTGYSSASTGFLLTAGSVVSAGTITLSPQLTSTTISGIVKDTASGKPVSGAQVQLLNGAVATTGIDGAYSLTGLLGASFDLRVSAIGYVTQSVQLLASKPSNLVQDIALQVQTGAGLSLDPLLVSPGSAASRTDISIGATVSNAATGAPVSAVLVMQVLNAQGKVISSAIAYDKTGANLVGAFTLNPAQQLPVMFRWNTGQFPAGTYSLIARVVEAGSINQTTPLGRILAEAQGTLTITADQHFGGTITANPPVLQANTNTPVHLSAMLANDGNADLPAQAYQLQVIDEKTGVAVATQQANGNAFAPSALQSLSFADWLPAAGGGNYRIELQVVSSPALGKVIGKVYVGDAATAAFTVNKLVVPAGTQAVKGNIHVVGQDATQGTISDPLAPLIKAAVQKAVTYNDATAANWYSSNRCLGCHVVSQALVGGELNRNITTFNASQRQLLFNALTTNQQASGAIYASHPEYMRTQTILGLWALGSWYKKSEVISPMAKAASFLIGQQEAAGSWTADHASGWWITRAANTGLTLKSMVDVDALIKQTPAFAAPVTYSLTPIISGSSIPGSSKGSAVDTAGNIYVTSYTAGTLSLVKPDGTVQALLSGLPGPRPPAIASDGSLYIPSDGGVFRYTLAGQKTTLTTLGATNVALGPDGNMYAANYWSNKITMITPAGTVSDYIVGGGLSYPHGIGFDQAGALLVTNAGNYKVLKYNVDKTYSEVIPATTGAPYYILQAGTDYLVATSAGLFRYNSTWQGESLVPGFTWSLAKTPDGKIFVGSNLDSLFVLQQNTLPMQLETSISNASNWLLVDSNIDSNNHIDLAMRLIGMGSAKQHYAGTAMAATLQTKMDQVGTLLRSRQRADGGWGWYASSGSDSLVTAQVGVALDYLQPSPKDPVVQNAIKLLLSRQQADGSWYSENGILGTHLAATTWVAIWLPIALDRIGGIDTDLTVAMPANVSLSNPSVAPTSSAANAAGGTDYLWKLQGVTSTGRDINFDMSLANMTLGENRPVASDAYMTFNNSFTQLPVKAPVAAPRVTASAFLGLGVTTDKTSYGANTPVNISAVVNNTSVGPLDGSVKLEIYGADNILAAVVGTQPFASLAAGTQRALNATWSTGTTAAGGYYALATLYDAQNRQVGTAQSAFNIVSGTGGGTVPGATGVGAAVTLDKLSYLPFDAVKIAGRITNLTQNQAQSGLQAVLTIYRPDGTVLWSQVGALQQLLAGTFIDLGFGPQLSAAPAGQYRVALAVQTAAAVEVARSESFFTVLSTADTGSGLKGVISALPKIVPQTDPVILNWTVSNLGNAGFTALPVTVSIVDPATQQVMMQQTYSIAVAQGLSFQTAFTWETDPATVGTIYVAILTATVGGKDRVLAQDNFLVTEPPVRLNVTQSSVRENRVLVWLACTAEEEHKASEEQKTKHDGGSSTKKTSSDKEQPHAVPACIQTRTAYLQNLLPSLKVPYLITSNREDFKQAFRGGRYNVYWLSGEVGHDEHAAEQDKAHKDSGHKESDDEGLFKEIREAVYRGDGLILDGAQTEHGKPLQEAVGLSYRGQLTQTTVPLTSTNLLFAAGSLPTLGHAQKMLATTGVIQASFDLPVKADEHQGDDEHKPAPVWPAIVGNDYGRGHALAFGFDLVDTLQNSTAPQTWPVLLQTGLAHLLPPLPDTYSAGAYVALDTRIQNLAKAVDLAVSMQLPIGATLLQTVPVATLDANGQPAWRFTLPLAATQPLLATMRLPALSGNHTARTLVDSIRKGKSKRYGEYTFNWTVAAGDWLASSVMGDLQALVLIDSEEREARDAALTHLQQATAFIAQAKYAEALEALLSAVDKLREIHSVDMARYRLSLDSLLQETAWNWLRTAGL